MKTSATIEPEVVSTPSETVFANPPKSPRCFLLGLPFDRMTLDETVEECVRAMRDGRSRYLATPNVDFTRCAASNPELSRFLMSTWRNTCDGLPLVWLSGLLGEALPGRVTGSDLTPMLLERCAREGFGVFFLGSDSGTLKEVAEKLESEYPGIDIRGWHAPPFGPVSDWDHSAILRKLDEARPDLVLVATGSPKQEEWSWRYQQAAGIPLCMGVGASLDFVTGKQVRAPRWVQRIGMEWFWRLSGSPKRLLGRYAADFGFFFRAAFCQWRFHRFWKPAESDLPPPFSESWENLDLGSWLESSGVGGRFPEGPLLLVTSRVTSFDHPSFNRFAEAVMTHRRNGQCCALWNPPRSLKSVVEIFGWQTILPFVRTPAEAGAFFSAEDAGKGDGSDGMKVLLSAGMIQGGRSGVGRYVIELARQLSTGGSGIELHLAGLEADRDLFPGIPDVRWVTIPRWASKGALNLLWHQTFLRSRLREGGYDLLHIPSYRRIVWRCPVPQVATIHDCAPFEFRNKYGFLRGWFGRNLVPILAKRCDHIIGVSRNTADGIVRFMGLGKEKISTIPNGIDHGLFCQHEASEIEAFLADRGEQIGSYFLYVARLEHPAKNHVRLIEAFEQFAERNPDKAMRLVFAGSDWHGATEIHDRIRRSECRSSIRWLGFVPDEDLPFWYGGARALVMPTLFEGFGIPVIEALASGAPVICSDLPVLREVGGPAVTCFDPKDPSAISGALEGIAGFSEAERKNRIRQGRAHSAGFDWEKVGESVSRCYVNRKNSPKTIEI